MGKMVLEKSWLLTDRQLCDIEMILDKSFSPLDRFMNKDDYLMVLSDMRLATGELFPIPITLDVDKKFSDQVNIGEKITLREKEGFKIATMVVESIWEPDFHQEAEVVYGTIDHGHPAVNYMFNIGNKVYLGGVIEKISMPNHYDYRDYRLSPNEAKMKFKDKDWKKIVAFQTRNPLHRAHIEMTLKSMEELDAKLFLHPVVGMTKPGDVDHYTRVRCYQHIIEKYPRDSAVLALLPLAMRMGGPREALLHAIIRKNYGCTHIIVGRDHAGPGNDSKGNPFYGPYDAQELLSKYKQEIGIEIVPFKFMVYTTSDNSYKSLESLDESEDYQTISGTELRDILDKGDEIPEWFSYPEVAEELKKSRPPLNNRGFTIFFTGLSGSGKSTIANGLLIKFLEEGSRPVTLLDGDIVRTHLSSELGFSREHRSLNVQRIGFVASEITKNGGIAICAPIAPYEHDRKINRDLISRVGSFIEVYVNTSLEKCEERDSKGLYKLAREGKIKEFTGISDPYEKPKSPDIVVNSDGSKSPEELVDNIFQALIKIGYLQD
ncbi:MAG: adenylyltransferase [Candidatus Marinimicrobia bacterium]|nr:adenylyltransferase [Candidatus Neomarinimicrobiota bacterium]